MLHSFPYIFLFSTSLIMGSLITIISNQWVFLWVGLEINLLSIVPLILSAHDINQRESTIKYFLIQAVGSALILIRAISYFYTPFSFISSRESCMIIISGLIIKLGVAPLHYWFPQVIRGLRWSICVILSTWQKLPPLLLLIFLIPISSSNQIILYVGLLSIWVGGLGGLNQTQLRPLLAYSSIAHIGWIIILSSISNVLTLTYLLVYILSSISIISLLMASSASSNSVLPQFIAQSPSMKLSSTLLLLNLGGMPPLLGFFPKLLAVYRLIASDIFIISLFIVIGSVIGLFYYLSILFNSYLSPVISRTTDRPISYFLPIRISMTLIPFPFIIFII